MEQLYLGDCLEVLKTIPDKSVDLVVTDPPYLIEIQGGEKMLHDHSVKVFTESHLEGIDEGFNFKVLDELQRVMKKTNIYLFCSLKQIPLYLEYYKGYNWNLISWHKTTCPPLCGNKYLNDTEYCLFFRDRGVKVYGDYDTKHTYYLTPPNIQDKEVYNHPTIKPLQIIENLIINSSKKDQTVLDCFMGSGTTGVAAKKLQRNFIGIEIEPKYYEIAKARINGQHLEIKEQLTMF